MKAAKKERQRKRRAPKRAKASRRKLASEDKSFGAAMVIASKKGFPHMEWDGAQFAPTRPKPPPRLDVNVSVMHEAHKKFGVTWSGSRRGIHKSHKTDAVSDTGCQTCTAGTDFLEEIGCPESHLVPTSHGIVGITSSNLDIIGSVMLRIEFGGNTSRQMVHISRTCRGLYLSELTLMDLKVIPRSFPLPAGTTSQTAASTTPCCRDDGSVPCLKRTPTPELPAEIPFAPTRENVPKLEQYLLDIFASSAFNMCTNQPLQGMSGAEMNIVFRKDAARPRPTYTPIPVAHHWKKQVKADLDQDERLGIIEKVPQSDVTEWCSRMVVTPKASGKPRRTVDLQQLNKNTIREVHHTPSPFNLVSMIPAGMFKTVLDAWNGYHSLMLSLQSKPATTFITEWGRYRYCRGPQGYHGTGDAYTRRFDDITADEKRYVRCIDDGCLWDDDIEKAFWHVFAHIKHCADNGIVFNREKFRFARENVEFAGFEVTKEGFRPSQQILTSIRNFRTPTCLSDIRSWFGLVQQVAYTFSESRIMDPFRDLLKKGRKFYWDDNMSQLLQHSKDEIILRAKEGVTAYDLRKPTCLATDWSKTGLGFTLTQKHCKCSGTPDPNCGMGHWKLVHAGSRFTQKGERNLFSPTEGECLAAVFGLEKCRMFTSGCPDLTLAVDHQPLTRILNDRSLDSMENPRLMKLKERTLPYSFRIVHVSGTSNAIKGADALSRSPVGSDGDDSITDVSRAFAVQQADGIDSVTWNKVKEAAIVDDECVGLSRVIIDGFPADKHDLPPILQPYWGMRDSLYVIDGVPFKGRKMLIPVSLRPQVLEGLHAANQGVTGMMSNARERLFWPGLDAAVRQLRLQCRQCNEEAPSQSAEPSLSSPPPEVPFEQTVTDLCSIEGHTFLIYADRFSGWVEIDRLSAHTFRHVRQSLLRWFATYGVPEELSSDGGPPYKSQFLAFLKKWDIRWRLSSVAYPQSNGRAEAAVKSAKRILRGNINPSTGALDTCAAVKALLTHRNTPCQDTGISPSVMLFGRPIRDHLPHHGKKLRPEWGIIFDRREEALSKRVTIPMNSKAKELQALQVGDSVQVQNQTGNHPGKWNRTGIVTTVLPNRQYHIVMDGSRRVTLRNRRFLRKILPVSRNTADLTTDMVLPRPGTPLEPPPAALTGDAPEAAFTPLDTRQEVETLEQPSPHPVVDDSTRVSDTLTVPPPPPSSLRRGTRERRQHVPFSAKLTGKTHE